MLFAGIRSCGTRIGGAGKEIAAARSKSFQAKRTYYEPGQSSDEVVSSDGTGSVRNISLEPGLFSRSITWVRRTFKRTN